MADGGIEEASTRFEKELDALIVRKEKIQKEMDTIKAVEKKIETILAESKKADSDETDLKTRDILLKYYSSECTIHGAYIPSVAIGAFAFLQAIEKINTLGSNIAFPIMAFISSGFVTISILFLARIFYWGKLTSMVTHVQEMSVEEAKKTIVKEHDKITFLLRLHRACIKYFKEGNKKLNYLVGVDIKIIMRRLYLSIFLSLWIIFWVVLLINGMYF